MEGMLQPESIVENKVHRECGDRAETKTSSSKQSLIAPSAVCRSPYKKLDGTQRTNKGNNIRKDDEATVKVGPEYDIASWQSVILRGCIVVCYVEDWPDDIVATSQRFAEGRKEMDERVG